MGSLDKRFNIETSFALWPCQSIERWVWHIRILLQILDLQVTYQNIYKLTHFLVNYHWPCLTFWSCSAAPPPSLHLHPSLLPPPVVLTSHLIWVPGLPAEWKFSVLLPANSNPPLWIVVQIIVGWFHSDLEFKSSNQWMEQEKNNQNQNWNWGAELAGWKTPSFHSDGMPGTDMRTDTRTTTCQTSQLYDRS